LICHHGSVWEPDTRKNHRAQPVGRVPPHEWDRTAGEPARTAKIDKKYQSVVGLGRKAMSPRLKENIPAALVVIADREHAEAWDTLSTVVGESMTIHFGDETVRIIATPGSHDATDVIVYFTKAGIVCMGDSAYGMMFPSIAPFTGNLLKYPKVIDKVLAVIPDTATIISGHGRDTSVKELRQFRDMLAGTAAVVKAGLARGEDVATMQKEDVLVRLPDRIDFRRRLDFPVDRQVGQSDVIRAKHLLEKGRARGLEGKPLVYERQVDAIAPETEPFVLLDVGRRILLVEQSPSVQFHEVHHVRRHFAAAVAGPEGDDGDVLHVPRSPAGPSIATTRDATCGQSAATLRIAATASPGATSTAARWPSRSRSATRASKWSG
jgi:glyoxylase-like metal-dependent hydrolase (beta-lactamase superfamily II)